MKNIGFAIIALFSFLWMSACNTQTNAQQTLSSANENTKEILKQMPAAKKGYKRVVIILPAKKNMEAETNFQVEIIPGKMMKVDCNRHGLQGNFEEKQLEGFGYIYYEFNSKGEVMSTMIGCPDNKLHDAFVSGETKMLRYNSRMPLVVYIPEILELRYKIWKAGELVKASER